MVNFHGWNDSTLWGYKEKHLLYPIDKSEIKVFNERAHWGLSKIKYKGKWYSIEEEDWCLHRDFKG